MPAITATAPGKIILFGEHAVVYGRAAIAVPVNQVKARAVVSANPRGKRGEIHIQAPDIELDTMLSDLASDHPLVQVVRGVLDELEVDLPPACILRITSTIPVASGMGSGASVSVAAIRALSAFLGRSLPDERVSALTYEIEKIYHGTPSGIDNTVVTHGLPVYFVRQYTRDEPKNSPLPAPEAIIDLLKVPVPFTIVIGDTGVPSPTAIVVGEVRRQWQADHDRYEEIFDAVSRVSQEARQVIEEGHPKALGSLMDENHRLLQEMDVSSSELDCLVETARDSGAQGAKLSGAGWGGNMIALVDEDIADSVALALLKNGAAKVIITTIRSPEII